MKVTDYTIVGRPSPMSLEYAVKGLIQGGWQPLGAPYYNPKDECMDQAMIKHEEEVEVET